MTDISRLYYLCEADSMADRTSRGFDVDYHGQEVSLFVVRRDGNFYAYRNMCPHALAPLNWKPDQFLDRDHRFIQCGMHGAIFEIDSGLCIRGPCLHQSLWEVELVEENGKLYARIE